MPNTRDNVTWQHTGSEKAYGVFTQIAAVTFSDSAKELMVIPAGASIQSIEVLVAVGFDGTTPTYDVGYLDGDTDALVDGGTLSASVAVSAMTPPSATVQEWVSATGGTLVGTFAGGGSNTAGAGSLRVTFFFAE